MRWATEEDDFLHANHGVMSHAEIGVRLGRTAQAVRNRCWRLGLVDKGDVWTDEEIVTLREAYEAASCNSDLNLEQLSERLGRLKSNVSRKARMLGLTDIHRMGKKPEEKMVRLPKFSSAAERAAASSKRMKDFLAANGHPRGALGMKHSPKTLELLSKKSREAAAARTPEQKAEIALKMMKTRVANGTTAPERPYASWKASWHEIGGKRNYYRSNWEANYAKYLEWLKGLGQIRDWEHEPKTFWFEGIKRGTVSYLPDFLVIENDGSEVYHEVKGWMDDRSRVKIKRMARYHPDVSLVVIDSKAYREIRRKVSGIVPGWQDVARDRRGA